MSRTNFALILAELVFSLLLLSKTVLSDIVIMQGAQQASGKGGIGIINGSPGDIVNNGVNIRNCLKKNKIKANHYDISVSGGNIYIKKQEKILKKLPLTLCSSR